MESIRVPSHIHYTVTEDTMVLMDTRSGRYFGLDEIATRFWQLLIEQEEREKTLRQLEQELMVPRERLETDLKAFLAGCQDRGLLQIETDAA
jgi:hypothetical protein